MKNSNNLDKLFKEKLGESKGAHPEHLWQGIEHRLDQINGGSNKRRILFLSIALLMASLMIGSAVMYNLNKVDDTIPSHKSDKPATILNDDLATKVIIKNSEITDKNTGDQNNGDHFIAKKVTSIVTANNSDNLSKPISVKRSVIDKKQKMNDNSKVSIQTNSNINQDNFFYNESGNLVKVFPNDIKEENEIINIKNIGIHSSLILSNDIYNIDNFVPKDGCLDYVDKPFSKMFIDILGGSQMTDRLLYTEDAAWQDNVTLRNESETVKNSYSFGLRFTYMFDRGVSLKSGLLYSVINEELKYVSGIKTITIRDEQTGEITRQYEEKEYALTNNRYVFYDIPLLISYNWTKKKVFAEFNSGLILNIYAKQNGEFYNQKEERIKFNKLAEAPFKSFVGGSLYTSAAFGYNFPDNNASFFVEPHVRYHLGSISSKSYPIKQKYVNYGLYLGIRYQIK